MNEPLNRNENKSMRIYFASFDTIDLKCSQRHSTALCTSNCHTTSTLTRRSEVDEDGDGFKDES